MDLSVGLKSSWCSAAKKLKSSWWPDMKETMLSIPWPILLHLHWPRQVSTRNAFVFSYANLKDCSGLVVPLKTEQILLFWGRLLKSLTQRYLPEQDLRLLTSEFLYQTFYSWSQQHYYLGCEEVQTQSLNSHCHICFGFWMMFSTT